MSAAPIEQEPRLELRQQLAPVRCIVLVVAFDSGEVVVPLTADNARGLARGLSEYADELEWALAGISAGSAANSAGLDPAPERKVVEMKASTSGSDAAYAARRSDAARRPN